MRTNLMVFLMLVPLIGCTPNGGMRFDGGWVNEITAYHHQIVLDGRVTAEGYVYGIKHGAKKTYIIFSEGHPFVCGDSDAFVLEKAISIIVIDSAIAVPHVSRMFEPDMATQQRLDMPTFQREQKALENRLPMLFDTTGCSSVSVR